MHNKNNITLFAVADSDHKISSKSRHKFERLFTERGYLKLVKSSLVNPSTKLVEVSIKTVMFQKGIDWLDKMLSEHFVKNTD